MAKTVEVIGAGPSGLFLTYALLEKGHQVRVYEERQSVGGMVQTLESPWGRIETSANAFMNSIELEAMAKEISVPLIEGKKASRRRFVFLKGRPVSVGPMSLGLYRGIIFIFQYYFLREKLVPKADESVFAFGVRVFGNRVTTTLLIPALQGIYAGDPNSLSASLIFGKFFRKREPGEKPKKTELGKTVSPEKGMGAFFHALYLHCLAKGVEFHFGKKIVDAPKAGVTRIYTGNPRQMLGSIPQTLKRDGIPALLNGVDVLPLTSVALFFDEPPKKIQPGFGILFPRAEGVRSLGVLFNEWIFDYRTPIHSETWIVGGALDREVHKESDDSLLALVLKDREKALGDTIPPKFSRIQRWPDAIPHFDLILEEILRTLSSTEISKDEPLFFGTFLGNLGIGGLLAEARKFAQILATKE